MDRQAKHERQQNNPNLFLLLDAELLGRDTQLIHSLNNDILPSSLGRVPVNEFCDKSNDPAQKERNGLTTGKQNKRRPNIAKLFMLLDAEPQGRDTKSIHSLNSIKLPSSLGRVPLNELCDKSNDAAQKKEIDR
jgi:hypothetical protein